MSLLLSRQCNMNSGFCPSLLTSNRSSSLKYSHGVMHVEFVVAKIASAKIKVAPAKVCKDIFHYMLHMRCVQHNFCSPLS